MNAAFNRKMVSDELRETLFFCGLIKDWHCKIKEVDSKNKPRYRLETTIGDIFVYGPKQIFIKDQKLSSMFLVRQELYKYL
jgi:hypothetical protein